VATPLPVEVVVVNDGSSDCTAHVVEALESTANAEVRYIHQANAGLAAARNRGLHESRGEYLVFLDADDRLTPHGIETGVAALEAHPESAFVFGRCRVISAAGAVLPSPGQPRMVKDHYRELLRRNYIGTAATVAFRREAVERAGGFNPAVNATADYELYLHIARHHPVHDHGQVVAHHRKHDANMSGNVARMLAETLTVLRGQRPFLEGDAASIEAVREGRRLWQDFYGSTLATRIREDASSGNWWAAACNALALAWYHPRGLVRQAFKPQELGTRLAQSRGGGSQ
jgi:glycosyltransferase involved in cell wall biosynthesis